MTLQNTQDRTETGQRKSLSGLAKIKRLPKTHQDYWSSKLKKRSYQLDGKTVEIPTWQVRLFHLGRESWFNLDTANKATAAVKARDIYLHLISKGWSESLAKFKPDMEVSKDGCTVGEFLDQVKAVSGLKPVTFEIYGRKFRSVVAGVFNIDGGKRKHDYVNGGHRAWLDKVRAVRLERLTPEKVNDWKVGQFKSASRNPLQLKRAHATVRSLLLSAKALFSDDIKKHLTVRLPSPLPFDGVALPEVGRHRYKSEINPALLLQQARRELAEGFQGEGKPLHPRPELFKIALLALGAGLRRDEIDTLQWTQIKWDRNIIRIETTEHGSTKSADSEADVAVDPGLLEILRGYMPKPGKASQFVIESPIEPRPKATSYHHYRADRLFKQLIVWLRGKGITARNALHSLRKEFGSQICAQGGIYAASVALRHANITITRDHYLDQKTPVVFQVASLLQAKADETGGGVEIRSAVA